MPLAEISWTGSRRDQRALAERHDWSALRGLEQLWGQLAELHGESPALEAPHAKPPEQLSFRGLHQQIEQAAEERAAPLRRAAQAPGGPGVDASWGRGCGSRQRRTGG